MRHLEGHRRVVDQDDLMAPVELVGLARLERQRHIGLGCQRATLARPALRVAPDGIIATLKAKAAHLLEDPDQRQPLTGRLAVIA
jgi:hypothetical protein